MDEILPGLWLGSKKATMDKELLEQTGITHILSVGTRPKQTPDTIVDMKFLEVEDDSSGDMLSLFPEAVEFIT